MKKLLCIFTLLALVSATVYAESKKDTKADFINFTEEQIQSVSNSIKDNSVIAKELKTFLNDEVTELEENEDSPQNPTFKQTRLKTFFDTDSHGVKKYAETSTAILDTYNQRCGSSSVTSTDDISWGVEKTRSSHHIDVTGYGANPIYLFEYDFSIECPNGGVYIAYKLCFTTVKNHVYEYVDCDLYRANINRR